MSLHTNKYSIFRVLSVGILLIPSILNITNTSAAIRSCNKSAKTITEAVCMQDMNDEVLTSMVLEQQYVLRDSRDNKTYSVVRLKDGHVWMTQNLDFDLNSNVTLTPNDTDIKSNFTPAISTEEWSGWTMSTLSGDGEDVSGEGNYYYEPYSYDVGDLYWNGESTVPNLNSPDETTEGIEETTVNLIENTSLTGERYYHLGNYYNWTAAVASNDTSEFTEEFGEADQSICPAGWTLPLTVKDSSPILPPIDIDVPVFVETGDSEVRITSGVADLASVYNIYVTAAGGWDNFSAKSSPFYVNYSGINMDYVGGYGAYWARDYVLSGGGEEEKGAFKATDVSGDNEGRSERISGFYGSVDDYYAESDYADAYWPVMTIRCVARANEIIEANWEQGEEHQIGDDEEGILRVEIPVGDDIEEVFFDDEMIDATSGIELVPDEENEGVFRFIFPSEFLDELSEGDHTVRLVLTSGRTAQATLTVAKTVAVPNTGSFTAESSSNSEDRTLITIIASLAIAVATSIMMAPVIYSGIKKIKKL
ncbi:hypothetical protein IJS18_01595 [Candidatus Saccharibacteria bacterium]|nr:hypothetical protein [Candidatus Saccharibacteria bacterium]